MSLENRLTEKFLEENLPLNLVIRARLLAYDEFPWDSQIEQKEKRYHDILIEEYERYLVLKAEYNFINGNGK